METQSLLIKVSVADVSNASKWYQEKLGFVEIFKYENIWARMSIPGYTNITYGLSSDNHPTNSGGEVTTLIVPNVVIAKAELEEKGVTVGPVIEPGAGVKLAFFSDLDGNSLGLRQEQETAS